MSKTLHPFKISRAPGVPPFRTSPLSGDPTYWHEVTDRNTGETIGYVAELGAISYVGVWAGRMPDGSHVWQTPGDDRTRTTMAQAIYRQAQG